MCLAGAVCDFVEYKIRNLVLEHYGLQLSETQLTAYCLQLCLPYLGWFMLMPSTRRICQKEV